MVELFVGGITQADRDAVRDLVEDAVLNIRSAAENGVGLGANMSAAIAIMNMRKHDVYDECDLHDKIIHELLNAYAHLVDILFTGTGIGSDNTRTALEELYDHYLLNGTLYNIRENIWTTNVKTSIKSDMTILDTVSKIITIMGTCNQFIVPSAAHNIYTDK